MQKYTVENILKHLICLYRVYSSILASNSFFKQLRRTALKELFEAQRVRSTMSEVNGRRHFIHTNKAIMSTGLQMLER